MFPNGICSWPSFAFPWLYATANMLLIWRPVQGSAQGPIASWYSGSLFWLWLVPLTLAGVYYLVPHIARRPVRAYPSSALAFWCLTLLGGWIGTRQLIGGPVPAWMVSASVAASIIMLIPVTVICINTLGTFSGRAIPPVPEASFTVFGIGLFCRGRPARGGDSAALCGNTFFRLLDSRECAGYFRLHQHGALWRFALCRAAPHGKGFLAAGRDLAFLAFCVRRGDNVSGTDLRRRHSRIRAL